MPKAAPVNNKNGPSPPIGYMIMCPACECGHIFYTGRPDGRNWTFNGDVDNPTFSPSMLVYSHSAQPRCHSFVRDGKIQFLNDCEHSLKGQTVELPDIDKDGG